MTAVLDTFFEYAGAFEKTYQDDDWERLRPYFAADAVYEVVGGPLACRIEGVDGILEGLKKSIDGLDRRCDERIINVTDEPRVDGDTVYVSWKVGYVVGESPLGEFAGKSQATIRDGQIIELKDLYDDAEMVSFGKWQQEYAPGLDGTYV